jgi:hypothetical protein
MVIRFVSQNCEAAVQLFDKKQPPFDGERH